MSLNTYTPNTIIQSSQINADLTGLSNGLNDTTNNSMSTFRSETVFDFVSACVWSGDSYAVNRNASQTAGVVYISGVRLPVSAVSGHTFTASKDTYTDINGSGVQVYTETTNNAASPALAAGSVRIGIIITGATTIAAATSVNQGQETMVLPIASSVAYSVSDSLGNLICPRDPAKKMLSKRTTSASNQSGITTVVDVTGLSLTVTTDGLRKIKITATGQLFSSVTGDVGGFYIKEGATIIKTARFALNQSTSTQGTVIHSFTPTAGSHTYKMTFERVTGTGTLLVENSADPGTLTVELV